MNGFGNERDKLFRVFSASVGLEVTSAFFGEYVMFRKLFLNRSQDYSLRAIIGERDRRAVFFVHAGGDSCLDFLAKLGSGARYRDSSFERISRITHGCEFYLDLQVEAF